MLQDICSASGKLPSLYSLDNATVNYKKRIYRGGEAFIFFGELKGQTVAIREVFPPENNTWDSPVGKDTIMVRLLIT
jgi:hypothetical protein